MTLKIRRIKQRLKRSTNKKIIARGIFKRVCPFFVS